MKTNLNNYGMEITNLEDLKKLEKMLKSSFSNSKEDFGFKQIEDWNVSKEFIYQCESGWNLNDNEEFEIKQDKIDYETLKNIDKTHKLFQFIEVDGDITEWIIYIPNKFFEENKNEIEIIKGAFING